jgi:hypothetical protein
MNVARNEPISQILSHNTHWVILAAIDAATPPNQNGYGAFFFVGFTVTGAGVPAALIF